MNSMVNDHESFMAFDIYMVIAPNEEVFFKLMRYVI